MIRERFDPNTAIEQLDGAYTRAIRAGKNALAALILEDLGQVTNGTIGAAAFREIYEGFGTTAFKEHYPEPGTIPAETTPTNSWESIGSLAPRKEQ